MGQPSEFKDFQSWLKSDSTKKERETVIGQLDSVYPLIEQIQEVHAYYLEKYGVKNSFYKFVNEVLPKSARDELLSSIMIRKIDSEANRVTEEINDKAQKLKFLFDTRNSYTHHAVNTGSPASGVFENFGGAVVIDGAVKYGYVPIRHEQRVKFRYEYSVRRWLR